MSIDKYVDTPPQRADFAASLARVVDRCDLSSSEMTGLMEAIISAQAGDAETAALLVALAMKGESATEIAAAAAVLRRHMIPLETGCDGAIDTCGTGGDGVRTFNISTAVALVVAGAGLPVVKHGNRAVSSRSGSADVLTTLGVIISAEPSWARRCLDETGLAFCFAPYFHPALKHLAPLRRRLAIRTLFNCLGPLANPGQTPYQLLGVGKPQLLDRMAGALAQLGTRQAFLVSGHDGLDEVSLAGPTRVLVVRDHQVSETVWLPEEFGLPCSPLASLQADSPQQSAAIISDILQGNTGPPTDIVLANAAAALLAAERVQSLKEGVSVAQQSLKAGRAAAVLEKLRSCR